MGGRGGGLGNNANNEATGQRVCIVCHSSSCFRYISLAGSKMDWTNNFTALWVNSADDTDDIFLISFSQKKKKKKKNSFNIYRRQFA